ncbi:MAG: GNAT family N-acetyltransferase [Tateyamaria sp.]|uniref:GNAT family N-acetyltransferase n=1 Tax=Tateyamaria sp. TaxID=1929288 RepID=UPI0032DDC4EC
MVHSVEPADASIAPERLADLLWNTDPKLNAFMFRTRDVLLNILRAEWPATRGLLSHRQAFTVMDGASVIGLLVGHQWDEYGPNFEAAQDLQTQNLAQADAAYLNDALEWMDRLFPVPRTGAYYILELSTAASAQGQGIASHLLKSAEERARGSGCTHIALDVSADNAAVDFYLHKGFEVEIETRVPHLDRAHGIGLHLHMSLHLDVNP